MNIFKGFFCGVIVAVACGCAQQEKPSMPLTRENVSAYLQKCQGALRGVGKEEAAAAQKDGQKEKELVYRCFVQPMESMGFSYDRTINVLSRQVLSKTLQTPDAATTIMLREFTLLAESAREVEHRSGFISTETYDLLKQVSALIPH